MAHMTLALHGGAGTISREEMTPEKEKAYRQGLEEALQAGYSVLESGGAALDAAKASVVALENHPLFNAGRGAVFTRRGINEMDAAVMDGKTGEAGAVCAVRNVRNPVELAAAVLRHSDHVLLSGEGAVQFAIKQGVALEPDEYFFTLERYDQWKEARDEEATSLDHSGPKGQKKMGTVGAVACDREGNVAAATSTGGMTNKKYGRVGDSPIIGGGTYANNETCALSATGHGEVFIKAVATYDVHCLMAYKRLSLEEAMRIVVMDKLVKMKGEGGMVGVDKEGNPALLFNSDGMYRAVRSSSGLYEVAIF
ncbi:MAG TPA: isoaspartyl peptidase/L-asparaginase [Chitinophagaceae bacterium]|jgi:beta-aspartyl-peptidase (threonine type)|nr:isoaspartyl peptidase/L-asparaginase [Chitinophagaceae bacterium]